MHTKTSAPETSLQRIVVHDAFPHHPTEPTFASYTPPTEIASATQAGADIPESYPSFPDAAKTGTPTAARLAIAMAAGVVEQLEIPVESYSPPFDKLMLTTWIGTLGSS